METLIVYTLRLFRGKAHINETKLWRFPDFGPSSKQIIKKLFYLATAWPVVTRS